MPRAKRAAVRDDITDSVRIVTLSEEERPRSRRPAAPRAGAGPRPVSADLLATVAHELRAPLSTLRVTLEMIAALPDGDVHDAVRLMPHLRRGVGWLERLVDNLTATALVHSGHLPLRCAPVSMDDCLDGALGVPQPLRDQRRQQI